MRMRFLCGTSLLAAFVFLSSVTAVSQEQEKTEPSPGDQSVADTKPATPKVTPPRPIYAPDPEYSKDARKRHIEGEVILSLTVEADGSTSNIKVKKSLRTDLDDNAVDAVKNWKFEPSTKDGKAVAVNVNIVVNFRLYKNP